VRVHALRGFKSHRYRHSQTADAPGDASIRGHRLVHILRIIYSFAFLAAKEHLNEPVGSNISTSILETSPAVSAKPAGGANTPHEQGEQWSTDDICRSHCRDFSAVENVAGHLTPDARYCRQW
jgi:hypothetical protein